MWRMTFVVMMVLTLSVPALAKPKAETPPKGSRNAAGDPSTRVTRETFSPAERNLIRAHLLGDKPASTQPQQDLPPGLRKKVARGKALPPGWQKKVAPGQSLNYQVYRQGDPLPDALLRRLPPPPVGSETLRVEDKIIRLNSATRTILDVFDLAPSP